MKKLIADKIHITNAYYESSKDGVGSTRTIALAEALQQCPRKKFSSCTIASKAPKNTKDILIITYECHNILTNAVSKVSI